MVCYAKSYTLYLIMITFYATTAARIGFERVMYNGSEADEVINVAVAVLSGTLSQEVVVRINTMDSSARCKNDEIHIVLCSLFTYL